jgi:tRNA(His) 5'-end guanylyltransferase
MEMLNAKCGYTQSDEISIIIPPASVSQEKGVAVQHPHAFNGRVMKICTLAASRVTVVFNSCLAKVCPTWADY